MVQEIAKTRSYVEEKNKKPVLLYDATLLANTYSRFGSDRTGVFFVAYQIFLRLVEQQDFLLFLYAEESKKQDVQRAVIEYGHTKFPVLCERELSVHSINIFLSPFHAPPTYIAKNSDIAKYVMLHDLTPMILPDIEAPNQKWFQKLIRSLNHRDRYITNSECTKKDFLRFFPILRENQLSVSYLGASDIFHRCTDSKKIDAVKKKYHIPTDISYVVSLCTLQPRKNLVHAVKCFFQFLDENNIENLYFVMIGGHWKEFIEVINQEINSLEEKKSFIIKTGYVDDTDVAVLLSDAIFTVYISLYEGFGLPVLEAMQCGCPVIASNTSSMPEVLGDCGILVDPLDPVALRKAYCRYYFDEAFRKQCSHRGLKRAKIFGWKQFVDKILEVIRSTWKITESDEMDFSETQPNLQNEWRAKRLGIELREWENMKDIEMYILQRKQESLGMLHQLLGRIEQGISVFGQKTVSYTEEALRSLEFYQILLSVETGKVTLQHELERVEKLVQKMGEV